MSLVTTHGVSTPIESGNVFPAYDLKSWKVLTPYRFEMAGVYRDSKGFLTESGDYCPVYEYSSLDQQEEEAALAGTWLGVRREIIPSVKAPHPGVAMFLDGTYCHHNFTIGQFRQLASRADRVEANLPLPRWWIECSHDEKGCQVLYDMVSGKEVTVQEVPWIPWAVDPLENLPESCRKDPHRFTAAIVRWSLDNHVDKLFIGYRPNEVGVNKVCMRTRPLPRGKESLDLQKVFANVQMRKTAALMNGQKYHPAEDLAAWDLDELLPETPARVDGGQVGSAEVLTNSGGPLVIPPGFDFFATVQDNLEGEEDETQQMAG